MRVETRDLDYLEAAIDQIRATPLQALATQMNKVVNGYLHPFNTYAENPPLTGELAVPLHRAAAWLTLLGLALSWRRPGPALALGGLGLAMALPFVVSHIDVRYVIPIALAAIPFAGYAASTITAHILAARPSRHLVAPAAAVGALALAARLDVPTLLLAFPSLDTNVAHRIHTAATLLALLAAGSTLGGWLKSRASLITVSLVVAAIGATHALFDPGWREWSSLLRPGQAAVQRIRLPVAWAPPLGARAEVRFYAQGAGTPTYVPVLRANGRELARLGAAFTEGGPLRFEERLMVTARLQGKARADVPQWYGIPLDLAALSGDSIEIAVTLDGAPGSWIRLWGDYALGAGQRVLEAPSIHSRIQGQDDSFHKFVSTGHSRLWRRFPLASPDSEARLETDSGTWTYDLSRAAGTQSGEFRIRVLVFGPAGDLVAVL